MTKHLPLLVVALLAACDAGGAQGIPSPVEAAGHARALAPLGEGVLLRLAIPEGGAAWDVAYTLQAGPGTGASGPVALSLGGGHTVVVTPASATGPGEVGLDLRREAISLQVSVTDEDGETTDPLALMRMATGHDHMDVLKALEGVGVRLSFTPRGALRDISNLEALVSAVATAAGASPEEVAQALADQPDFRAELANLRAEAGPAGEEFPPLAGIFPAEPVVAESRIGWSLAEMVAAFAPADAASLHDVPNLSCQLIPAGLRDGGLVFDIVVSGGFEEAGVAVTVGGGGEVVVDIATGLPRRAEIAVTVLVEGTDPNDPFTFPVEATLLLSPTAL